MLVLVVLTMLAAMTTGSGNAPFYAFVEMIPKLAHSSGINPAYLSIPCFRPPTRSYHFSGIGRGGCGCGDGENLSV